MPRSWWTISVGALGTWCTIWKVLAQHNHVYLLRTMRSTSSSIPPSISARNRAPWLAYTTPSRRNLKWHPHGRIHHSKLLVRHSSDFRVRLVQNSIHLQGRYIHMIMRDPELWNHTRERWDVQNLEARGTGREFQCCMSVLHDYGWYWYGSILSVEECWNMPQGRYLNQVVRYTLVELDFTYSWT